MTQTPQQTHQEPPNPKKRARDPLGPSIRGQRTRPTSNRTQDRYTQPASLPNKTNRSPNTDQGAATTANLPASWHIHPIWKHKPQETTRGLQHRPGRSNRGNHAKPTSNHARDGVCHQILGETHHRACAPPKRKIPGRGPNKSNRAWRNHAQDRSNRGKRAGNLAYTSRGTKSKRKTTRSHQI